MHTKVAPAGEPKNSTIFNATLLIYTNNIYYTVLPHRLTKPEKEEVLFYCPIKYPI